MTAIKPHPLADEQWHSQAGCADLVRLWDTSPEKLEAERIVGRLVAALGTHGTIIELGCGNGRIVASLPTFRTYWGYDTSPQLLAAAEERYKAIHRRAHFAVHDMFESPPNFPNVDVVICVHVARHYPDPLAVLRRALEWPARGYVLSAFHAPVGFEMLNGVCLATAALDEFLKGAGDAVETVEQAGADQTSVRYVALRPANRKVANA